MVHIMDKDTVLVALGMESHEVSHQQCCVFGTDVM